MESYTLKIKCQNHEVRNDIALELKKEFGEKVDLIYDIRKDMSAIVILEIICKSIEICKKVHEWLKKSNNIEEILLLNA